jgi:hypothetical protein
MKLSKQQKRTLRINLFFLIFFIASINIFGQDFRAGIRFGMDGSQVNGDQLSGFNKAGVILGGFVNRKISEPITLQMEIVYIQKGSMKPTDANNSFYRMRLGYIQVPVLMYYKIGKKINLLAGPAFGTLISFSEEDEYGEYPDPIPFEKFEFSGSIGISYSLGDNWKFDGRYSTSITTIRPFPGNSNLNYFDKGQYNLLIEFTLMYSF